MIKVKDVVACVRLNTSDEFVVNEVIKGNEYRKLHITPLDTVVDFGLNIGMFTITALKKGARVFSYEPEKDNFQLASYNVNLNYPDGRYKLYNAAVVGNDDVKRSFSINVKRNKGAHSLVAKRGRDSVDVLCENINTILQEKRPTIIKMDIEGGEYECIKAVKSFHGVKEFILEFHHAHLNDSKTKEKYIEILTILKRSFATVEYSKNPKGAWVTIIYCKK